MSMISKERLNFLTAMIIEGYKNHWVIVEDPNNEEEQEGRNVVVLLSGRTLSVSVPPNERFTKEDAPLKVSKSDLEAVLKHYDDKELLIRVVPEIDVALPKQ